MKQKQEEVDIRDLVREGGQGVLVYIALRKNIYNWKKGPMRLESVTLSKFKYDMLEAALTKLGFITEDNYEAPLTMFNIEIKRSIDARMEQFTPNWAPVLEKGELLNNLEENAAQFNIKQDHKALDSAFKNIKKRK